MSALERLGAQANRPPQEYSSTQSQTQDTFGFKWKKKETYESPHMESISEDWMIQKYLKGDPEKLRNFLGNGRKIILDAGCGSGYSALIFFKELLKEHDYLGVDISEAAWVAEERFKEAKLPGDFLQADICDIPIPDNSVDFIFSEGVLHHTDSTEKAIEKLSLKLKDDGLFLFYVYVKKAPIREYTDDYIRNKIKKLTNEEAWEKLTPLTKLGQSLGKLDIDIDIPEDIDLLGIKKGKINLQRLFYYHICKTFYHSDLSIENMNHINFDWFRPLNCHRHTVDEVKSYCINSGLKIEDMTVDESGITIIARKL